MKYIKLLWFDMRNGILRRPYWFAIPVLIAILACADLTNRVSNLNAFGYFETRVGATFGDYMIYLYGGMDRYVPGPSNPFTFPVRWTVVFLVISFVTLNYPYKDMQTFGQQILIRTRGRTLWWLSKCGWNVCTTMAYHLIFYVVLTLFCVATQAALSGSINRALLYAAFQVDRASPVESDVALPFAMLLLPVLLSLCINLLQMTISLFIKPIFGFFVTALLMISSAYLTSAWLIGNYAMPVRYDIVISKGVSIPDGIIISSVVLLASVLVGVVRFRRYDILNRD